MSELRRRIYRPVRSSTNLAEQDEGSVSYITVQLLSPFKFLLIFFLFITSHVLLGIYFNDRLPNVPSPVKDSSSFSTQNAFRYLKGLAEIGPKVTGSYENELQAVQYITNIITDIMKKTSHNITYDLQKASGEFSLSFLSKQVDLVYRNVQNIIVRIGPKFPTDKSLLLNCHFDSVPLSPGASDDGLNCAVMLEILRVIAVSNEILPNNIIFLFNGAEENPLLASHGFITQHKWAKDIKAFINLESCGAGGREVLFQTGPNHPWLIEAYGKAAKYPSGCVVAEEIFQSGLIPSDTDFRIFRDYGGKSGLDFAHCRNGFVYHTKFDNIQSIENVFGVIQHTGENILHLAKEIIQNHNFKNTYINKPGKKVYFDLFGLVFVYYSADFGKALNSVAVMLAVAGYYITAYFTHSWTLLRNFCLLSSTIMYGTVVLALVYNISLAYLLDAFGSTMSWYSNSIMIIPLYALPTVIIMMMNIIQYERYDKSKSNIWLKLKSQCLSVLLFWTTILFMTTFLNVRSTFLIMILVLVPGTYTFLMSVLKTSSKGFVWPLIFFITTVPSSVYFAYLGITAFRLFIPITGRFGAEKNPEIIISILATLFSAGIFSYIAGLILAVKKRWAVIYILIAFHFLTVLSVMFIPVVFPFSVESPQRVLATHVNRQFYDARNSLKRSDSLFWIQNMDRRGRNVLSLLNDAPVLDKFCEKDGFCGLPWYSKFQERSASSCISSAPHTLSDDTHLELLNKTFVSKNIIRFHLIISGPDHMGLILTPNDNCTLKSWSLPGPIHNRTSYMVGYVHGLFNSAWNINFDLQVPESHASGSFVKVEAYGLYFHHKKHFSKSFNNFLSKFPLWSHLSPCLSIYKYFEF